MYMLLESEKRKEWGVEFELNVNSLLFIKPFTSFFKFFLQFFKYFLKYTSFLTAVSQSFRTFFFCFWFISKNVITLESSFQCNPLLTKKTEFTAFFLLSPLGFRP